MTILLIAGLAVVVYMITQFTKTTIDMVLGTVEIDGKRILRRKAQAQKFAWLNRLVLPAIPPVLGFILGAAVPLRPEALIAYATSNFGGFWAVVIYAVYGAIVGNFADTIYTKVKAFVQDFRRPSGL